MPIAVGITLSLIVALFARSAGLDRERAFYSTVLIVVASYDVLFAAMSGSMPVLIIESILMAGFTAAAVAGFRSNQWILVAGLFGHGLFDAVHGYIVENTGMPPWWPSFCLAYDVGAAGFMAWFSTPRVRARFSNRGELASLAALLRQ